MNKHTITNNPAGRLGMALGLAFICLALLLGLSVKLLAQGPLEEEISIDLSVASFQPSGTTLSNTGVATVEGTVDVAGTATLAGSGPVTVSGLAPVTRTVRVSVIAAGPITVTGSVPVTGVIPVSISGATSGSDSVTVEGTLDFGFKSTVSSAGTYLFVKTYDVPVTGTLTVNATGDVTVTGSGPVAGSSSVNVDGPTSYVTYLPQLFRNPGYEFYDDFSDPSSGWQVNDVGWCSTEYHDGHFRITVNDNDDEEKKCRVFNTELPAIANGTFSATVRYISDEDRRLMYGFYFASPGGGEGEDNFWGFMVDPYEEAYEQDDDDYEPAYWLFYETYDGDTRDSDLWVGPAENIDSDNDDWNTMMIIRNGQNIRAYTNGEKVKEVDESVLLDAGYLNLVAYILGDNEIIVEFDDFYIKSP